MKIDFETLDRLAAAGAPASAIIEYLRIQDAKKVPKRVKDKAAKKAKRARQAATNGDMTPTTSDIERQAATLSDNPRARLFREGTSALMGLGRTERAARSLIAGWLKQTNDDEQLVTATILRARDMAVADAAGWITATIKGKTNGSRRRNRSLADAGDDLIDRAESIEREAGIGPGAEPEPDSEIGETIGR